MRLERKGGVKNDAQVADLRGWADGTAIDADEEIPNLPEQWLGGHNHELCLAAVQLEEVSCHPDFDVVEAVDQRLWGELRGR